MTKTHFRTLVVCYYLLIIIGGLFDVVFPNETLTLVTECLEALEGDWSNTKMILMGGYSMVAVFFLFYPCLGFLMFWNSARLVYLLGFFIFIPVYFFIGVGVSSPTGQALVDTVNVLSGIILVLIYYSPVKSYFIQQPIKSI